MTTVHKICEQEIGIKKLMVSWKKHSFYIFIIISNNREVEMCLQILTARKSRVDFLILYLYENLMHK